MSKLMREKKIIDRKKFKGYESYIEKMFWKYFYLFLL